jgi:1-acyl-sn-glycerol-3-phosphate acyltransferase
MKTGREKTPPAVSALTVKLFAAYSRHYLRQRFHACRILRSGLPPCEIARPFVLFLNHASWWDPLVCVLLAQRFFPHCRSFAPIDAAMLARYHFFQHLGFFPVKQNIPSGALAFFRYARAILAASNRALWLTPQGRFVDVRERPLRLRGGLGVLAVREPDVAFTPLAIEYPFWSEPRPEILCAFGEPIVPRNEPTRTASEWTGVFAGVLEALQDDLAARSYRREPADWLTLNRGRSGVSAVYDAWRWARAWLRGEQFTAEHQPERAR